jgi:hypothetical protein
MLTQPVSLCFIIATLSAASESWLTESDPSDAAVLLPIGYREETPPPPVPKLPLHALVYQEKFGEAFNAEPKQGLIR